MGLLDPDHARAEALLQEQQRKYPEAHRELLATRRSQAPVSDAHSPVVAFQRVAARHQAEVYCRACGAAHSASLVACDQEDSPPRHCPSCGEPKLLLIDAQSAHLVVRLHEALSPPNRLKLERLDALSAVHAALKLLL